MYDIKYNYRAHIYNAKCVLTCMNKNVLQNKLCKIYFYITDKSNLYNVIMYEFLLKLRIIITMSVT